MISSGQNYPPQGYGTQPQGYGYPPPGYYGQQDQGQPVGTYTPVAMPTNSFAAPMPTIGVSAEFGPDDNGKVAKMLDKQIKWAGWGGVVNAGVSVGNAIINGVLAHKSMEVQKEVAKEYYGAQKVIAGLQADVALEQLYVQEVAINAQVEMHGVQARHEEEMLRLEGSIQARLTNIQEDGKTKRAEIMTMSDAFSVRRGWDMGTPFAA